MALDLGPILAFRGVRQEQWHLSALTVSEAGTLPGFAVTVRDLGEVRVTPTKIGTLAYEAHSKVVLRHDFAIAMVAEAYTFQYRCDGTEHAVTVPGKGRIPRCAYASCNGFSSQKLLTGTQDRDNRWTHLKAKHTLDPYHLLMMGGDQLYSDSMWERIPILRKWATLPFSERARSPFTSEMRAAVIAFFQSCYVESWSARGMADVVARVPTVMMWDDHDIFDGWGSFPPRLQKCPVFRGIFEVARKHFALFQLQLAEGEGHPLSITPNSTSFSYAFSVGQLSVLALDMRSERTDEQVISFSTWKRVYDWMSNLPTYPGQGGAAHLYVLSSIPLVYPDFDALEMALGLFPGQQELEDDLRDHWRSRPHKQERLRFIYRLFDVSDEKGVRITLLSGDVHVGAVGIVKSLRRVPKMPGSNILNQLTSSGMVHPPPPGMVLYFLEHMAGKQLPDDRDLDSRMIEFPGTRNYYIGARNWMGLEPDDSNRIWVNWYVENEKFPFSKVIHPLDFELKEAIVPSGSDVAWRT